MVTSGRSYTRESRGQGVMSVRADRLDRARLRPFGATLFAEPHLAADRDAIDAAEHAVAVEVDEPAVVRCEPTPLSLDVEERDAPMLRGDVRFDLATDALRVVFEPTPHCRERIAHRDVDIFVR